jgi:hypothetical protein
MDEVVVQNRMFNILSMGGWISCGGTCSPEFKSLTWYECSYFSGFNPGFNGAILSMVGDIPVDSEASVVTS